MGSPATGQQLNHFRSDARGAIDRSQAEFKSSIRNVFSRPVDYLYAPDQRLMQINRGGSPLASYAYDAFGHRIGKTWPGRPLQTFAYAGSQLLAENAGTPSHYAYLDGQPLARIDGSAANSPIYYFHNHPLGVPLKASNAAGQTVWAAQLQPFGLMQTITAAISQNLRFPGQYFDAESGLHYNMARYYSPELGRYLQSDPIGLAGGVNTYTYVSNNPTNLIDPFGLEEGSPTNLIKRQLINDLALNYNGSTAWCFNCKKDNFPAGSNKCNKYVYDVTNQAGAKPLVNGRAPLAAEWATPSVTIPNWRALNNNETPQAGDVAAYTLSGGGSAYSGHTGIMTSDFFGLWDSNSSAHHDIVSPVLGQFENNPATVYRRFTGD